MYTKEQFKERGIELSFLQSEMKPYQQFFDEFNPYLSIIDVLMFNSTDDMKTIINDFKLL